jgi:hypothetical protein
MTDFTFAICLAIAFFIGWFLRGAAARLDAKEVNRDPQ